MYIYQIYPQIILLQEKKKNEYKLQAKIWHQAKICPSHCVRTIQKLSKLNEIRSGRVDSSQHVCHLILKPQNMRNYPLNVVLKNCITFLNYIMKPLMSWCCIIHEPQAKTMLWDFDSKESIKMPAQKEALVTSRLSQTSSSSTCITESTFTCFPNWRRILPPQSRKLLSIPPTPSCKTRSIHIEFDVSGHRAIYIHTRSVFLLGFYLVEKYHTKVCTCTPQ